MVQGTASFAPVLGLVGVTQFKCVDVQRGFLVNRCGGRPWGREGVHAPPYVVRFRSLFLCHLFN